MKNSHTTSVASAAHDAGLRRRGLMLVLSSPSGTGKTTIARAVLARDANIIVSVSYTTRPPRSGEEDGRDYHFVDQPRFESIAAKGGMLERARVFDNHYGTPRAPVEAALATGRDVLFDIDWQGTQQIAQNARNDLASIFVLPPSLEELERRLHTRAQDSVEVVRRRMSKASDEMSHWREYDYIIVNRDFEASVTAVQAILAAERLRRDRQTGLAGFVNSMRGQG
jgi:guanylate kinase